MAANVETTLELGLREAAETVWARKVLLEVLGPAAPFKVITLATHAHGKAVGRAEGASLALTLIRDAGAEDVDVELDAPIARLVAVGERAGELFTDILAEVGELVWDQARLDLTGQHGAILVALRAIPIEASWSMASTAASLRPLYPPQERTTTP